MDLKNLHKPEGRTYIPQSGMLFAEGVLRLSFQKLQQTERLKGFGNFPKYKSGTPRALLAKSKTYRIIKSSFFQLSTLSQWSFISFL